MNKTFTIGNFRTVTKTKQVLVIKCNSCYKKFVLSEFRDGEDADMVDTWVTKGENTLIIPQCLANDELDMYCPYCGEKIKMSVTSTSEEVK